MAEKFQERYNPAQMNEVKAMFYNYFHIGISQFTDNLLIACLGIVIIDIEIFDSWLHKEHGTYEDNNLSLNQFVEMRYGTEALTFLNKIS